MDRLRLPTSATAETGHAGVPQRTGTAGALRHMKPALSLLSLFSLSELLGTAFTPRPRRHAFPGAAPTARHPSCVRLPSLADGANGAPPCRAPDDSAGGLQRLGGLPNSRAWAVRDCSTSTAVGPTQRTPDSPPLGREIPNLSAVVTAAPVAAHVRAGLIEQSTRAARDGFPAWPQSTRPAGPIPAGVRRRSTG